jgi:hypothetical protein
VRGRVVFSGIAHAGAAVDANGRRGVRPGAAAEGSKSPRPDAIGGTPPPPQGGKDCLRPSSDPRPSASRSQASRLGAAPPQRKARTGCGVPLGVRRQERAGPRGAPASPIKCSLSAPAGPAAPAVQPPTSSRAGPPGPGPGGRRGRAGCARLRGRCARVLIFLSCRRLTVVFFSDCGNGGRGRRCLHSHVGRSSTSRAARHTAARTRTPTSAPARRAYSACSPAHTHLTSHSLLPPSVCLCFAAPPHAEKNGHPLLGARPHRAQHAVRGRPGRVVGGLRARRGHGPAQPVSVFDCGRVFSFFLAVARRAHADLSTLTAPLCLSLSTPSHSKEQWAAPTKGLGSWTSDTAAARYEARHDAALKALRRPRIDE